MSLILHSINLQRLQRYSFHLLFPPILEILELSSIAAIFFSLISKVLLNNLCCVFWPSSEENLKHTVYVTAALTLILWRLQACDYTTANIQSPLLLPMACQHLELSGVWSQDDVTLGAWLSGSHFSTLFWTIDSDCVWFEIVDLCKHSPPNRRIRQYFRLSLELIKGFASR